MTLNRRTVLALTAGLTSSLAMPAIVKAATPWQELEALAGQCLLVGFFGKSSRAGQALALARHIKAGRASGVLFLRHNIGTRADVASLTNLFHGMSADMPPLLSVDQEGGLVQRLKGDQGFDAIAKPLDVAESMSPQQAEKLYGQVAKSVKSIGFNLNLAPVVDVHLQANPAIGKYGRAFGTDPETIAAYSRAFVSAHRRHDVLTSLKHFPGQGLATGDTHDGVVDMTNDWQQKELEPFKKLVNSGHADMIMVGHISHKGLDESGRQLIFSKKVMKDLLRGDIGFNGVALTDDLDMGAIRKSMSLQTAIVEALRAGNDLLMLSNSLEPDTDLPAKACKWIANAVEDGKLSEDRLRQAANRVRAAKKTV
jgi:beta-N-acetylhexosaminidase